MGLRPRVPVPWYVSDIPFVLAVVEVPPAWKWDMHNLIGQLLVKEVSVVVVGVNVKPVVASFRDLVQEEIVVLLFKKTCCVFWPAIP